jgi:hypothetical protein
MVDADNFGHAAPHFPFPDRMIARDFSLNSAENAGALSPGENDHARVGDGDGSRRDSRDVRGSLTA